MYNGILPVYKEKGYTSFDVVACLRKILDEKKIGHTGTLDPDACGVLPVCLGNATKIAQNLTDSGKQYRAQMLQLFKVVFCCLYNFYIIRYQRIIFHI